MKDVHMAYIAGIIDGDGSLSLCKKQESNAKNPLYFPMIQFSKATPILPNLLQSLFGGSVMTKKRESRNLQEVRWKLEKSTQCRYFLESVVSLLKIKYEQGEELIDYIDNYVGGRGIRLSVEDLIMREKKHQRIKNLNAKRDTKSRLKRTKKYNLDENFWPYFAGLLDTDGSFSIKKETRGTYSPVILLSLINANALNYIESNYKGGSIMVIDAPTLKQKFYYRIGVYKKDEVIKVLKNVLPYLRNKRNSAELLLEFCEGYKPQNGLYLKTQEQTDFREKLYSAIILANSGVSKSHLIDLELLPGKAGDNRAQAGKPCSVNVASDETSCKDDTVL
jgi:hypothetical protein